MKLRNMQQKCRQHLQKNYKQNQYVILNVVTLLANVVIYMCFRVKKTSLLNRYPRHFSDLIIDEFTFKVLTRFLIICIVCLTKSISISSNFSFKQLQIYRRDI